MMTNEDITKIIKDARQLADRAKEIYTWSDKGIMEANCRGLYTILKYCYQELCIYSELRNRAKEMPEIYSTQFADSLTDRTKFFYQGLYFTQLLPAFNLLLRSTNYEEFLEEIKKSKSYLG